MKRQKFIFSALLILLWLIATPVVLSFAQNNNISASALRCLETVYIHSGTFSMGCTFEQINDCTRDEQPSHPVTLKGYAIGKYTVTQQLWTEIMGNNPSRYIGDNLPVHNISWDDIQVFIQRLNERTGMKFRLPTEAEWEYAARGGAIQGNNPYLYSGSSSMDSIGWFNENSNGIPHAIGTKKPNALGLYDMSGNVWEWCQDLYDMYSGKALSNPHGGKKGTSRVVRGGCYACLDNQCRVSSRKCLYQDESDASTGFRLALDDNRESRAAEADEKAIQEREAVEKAARRQERRNNTPPSVFFTLNTAYAPFPQWSYGFKIGFVHTAGVYLCIMTNFNYKGAFNSIKTNQHYVLTGKSKTCYLGGQIGLAIRPVQPLSIHIGAGIGYRTLILESDQGWYSYPMRTFFSPVFSLGFLFHIKSIALSAETSMMFSNPIYASIRLGVGFCLPTKKGNHLIIKNEKK